MAAALMQRSLSRIVLAPGRLIVTVLSHVELPDGGFASQYIDI
jgi:hypothetical protein